MEEGIRLRKGFGIVALLLCSIVIVVMIKGCLDGCFSSPEAFVDYIGNYGIMGPVVLTLIQMFQVVVPVVPGMVGCAAGAVLYGTVGGFICNYIGISAGSILAFWLARRYGCEFVKKVTGEKRYYKYTDWIQKQKSYTFIFGLMILLPLAPDDFLCYFTGLTRMSSKKFIFIILSMKPWLIMIYSLVFAGIL